MRGRAGSNGRGDGPDRVWCHPRDLVVRPPFSDLLPIRAADRAAIVESMRAKGYNWAFPIIVWRQKNIVVDGHVRVVAAREAGIGDVAVHFVDFADQDEAMVFAIDCQARRRNLT